MKKFSVVAALILCLLTCMPVCAQAKEYRWVRVVTDGVNFYASPDASKIVFTLEKSYYLEVLGEENGMYSVAVMQNAPSFPQICGYVWKSDVEKCDEDPLPPYYPTVKLKVNGSSAALKLSPVPSAETVVTLLNTQEVSYYGEIYYYNEAWYFVYFNGKMGYVLASTVTQPTIALHPTPLVQETISPIPPSDDPEPTDPVPQEKPQAPVSEIVLIVFVSLLALGITLAMFLPGNGKKKEIFDNEM